MTRTWQHRTESAAERGYGSAWSRLRRQVLARDLGLCQSCARQGRTTSGRDVDHVRPKAAGGTDDPENLQVLCEPCHLDKSAREQGKRRRPPRGPDGWSVEDAGHYVGPLYPIPRVR